MLFVRRPDKAVRLIGLTVVLVASTAFGQIPPVTEAPPAITFASWRQTADRDGALQFEEWFPSAFASGISQNDRVPLKVYVPKAATGPVPVVLILHYWGATDLKVERALAQALASKGMASAIMTLPYHLERTPPGYRSGALAIQPDPDHLIRTMTQSVLDVRRSVDFLQSRPEFDHVKIGIAGTSLGAMVSSLAYAVEPRFKTAVFMLGGVDLAHIIWNSSRVVGERESLRRLGFTEDLLRIQLKSIEPSEYLKNRAPAPAFVVGARYDTVIPRESTEQLIHSLPNCDTLWLDTGHYGGVFVQRRLIAEVAKFIASALKSGSYTPPSHLSAPTVRLAAEFSSNSNFNIEVGLDFIKQKGPRSPVGSLMIAPRGPRVFLGQGIDRGMAAGFFFKAGSVGAGLMWSTVL